MRPYAVVGLQVTAADTMEVQVVAGIAAAAAVVAVGAAASRAAADACTTAAVAVSSVDQEVLGWDPVQALAPAWSASASGSDVVGPEPAVVDSTCAVVAGVMLQPLLRLHLVELEPAPVVA